MGLDMYLYAERFFGYNEKQPEIEGLPIKLAQSEVAYWRKANAIHKWFVNNVQDGEDECQSSPVSREKLIELKEIVKRVLQDPRRFGPELLPTQSGFFFGDTDYGVRYVEDLHLTLDHLDKALLIAERPGWEIFYRASW